MKPCLSIPEIDKEEGGSTQGKRTYAAKYEVPRQNEMPSGFSADSSV